VLSGFLSHCAAQVSAVLVSIQPCVDTSTQAYVPLLRDEYTNMINGAFSVQDWTRVAHVMSTAAAELESDVRDSPQLAAQFDALAADLFSVRCVRLVRLFVPLTSQNHKRC
jgi:hypothetical protein